MAKITITKERRVGDNYDNEYDIDIRTTQKLTTQEYSSIITAIETISDILDPHFNTLKALKK